MHLIFFFQQKKRKMSNKTALYESHLSAGAKIVPFAGFQMPIQYKDGIIGEYKQVRENVGLFDVSHMGQIKLEGPGVTEFLSKITPSKFSKMDNLSCKYTVLTNENGGIIDDLIITKINDEKYYAVINAACRDKDISWIKQNLDDTIELEVFDNKALIAVQGSGSQEVLNMILKVDLSDLKYMAAVFTEDNDGNEVFVSRTGYTGEDGFEVSIPNDKAAVFWEKLLQFENVKPAGLGARDLLRIEMGYHLYGQDMDDTQTPIEVGLSWVVSNDNSQFFGAEKVLKQKQEGATTKRIGLKLKDKIVARNGAEIYKDGNHVGKVTSGAFSPILGVSISHCLVGRESVKVGDIVEVEVRNKRYEAEITKLPFMNPKTN